MLAKKGQVIVVTNGSFDDYRIYGAFRVLREFSCKAERERYIRFADLPGSCPTIRGFLKWLKEARECVEDTECIEWHLDEFPGGSEYEHLRMIADG